MNWVLKVGGSLYENPHLAKLLKHAQQLSRVSGKCTIVPGGGPFADQVRAADQRWHLDERTAHRMAMLGMRQYGRLLANISKLPVCCDDARSDTRCAVWLPSDSPTPACLVDISSCRLDWDFTSDSVAMCLARSIGAHYLVLLKAVPLNHTTSLAQLVDPCFMTLMQSTRVAVACVSAKQWLRLESINECAAYYRQPSL